MCTHNNNINPVTRFTNAIADCGVKQTPHEFVEGELRFYKSIETSENITTYNIYDAHIARIEGVLYCTHWHIMSDEGGVLLLGHDQKNDTTCTVAYSYSGRERADFDASYENFNPYNLVEFLHLRD
jgi:hypothetical protein